jgi:RHS repeat-associated protein
VLFSRGGRAVFVLPASFAFPQANEAEVHAARSTLRRSTGGWTLTVTPDRRWLLSALRRGPVVIDPTIDIDPDSQDCTIESDHPTTDYCSDPDLIVGYDARTPAHDHRSLVQFDLSVLPKDAVILNADLGLYLGAHSTNNAKQVGVYRLLQPWTNAATWNNYDATHAWGSAGAAGSTDASGTAAATLTLGTSTGFVDWYPTKLVQDWLTSAVPNYGVLLRDVTPNTTDNELGFDSREGTSAPELDIVWAPRTGRLGSYTFDSQRLTDRASLSVNVANGNLLLASDDLHVAGTGLDLDLTHYHNSMGTDFGFQGVGIPGTASLGRDVKLTAFPDGSVAFYRGDGVVLPFLDRSVSGGTASFTPPNDLNATLTQDTSTGVYTLTFNRTEVRELFNSAGQLTAIKDRNDNTIALSYYTTGGQGLQQVTDTQGRAFSFTQTAGDGDIDSISDPTGRSWSYTYDPVAGDYLTDYQDPAGHHTLYGYDASNRLNQITTPAGNVTKITYDGTTNRVASVMRTTDTGHTTGPTTTYAYSSSSPCTTGQNKTVVTDPNGHQTTYCSEAATDRVVAMTDAAGNNAATTYTANGDAATLVDAPGGANSATTTLSHDLAGAMPTNNLMGIAGSLGETSSWAYYTAADPDGGGGPLAKFRAKSFSDDQGTSRFYRYDGHGNVTDIGDAASSPRNTAHLTYNTNGTLASATDGEGHTTSFTYDASGNLATVTPPTPLAVTYVTHDGLSRVRTVQVGTGVTKTFSYDDLDRLSRLDVSDGSYFTYSYDADGDLTQRSDSAGNTTSYTVDALGRRTHEALPSSRSNDYTYDAVGNLKTIDDGSGAVTYSYDAVNRLTAIVSPTGSGSSTDTVAYSYDDAARKDTMTLPGGTTETYNYSSSGRLASISIKNSAGTTLRSLDYDYGYVSGGSTVYGSLTRSVTDQTGQKTIYTYKDSTVPEDVGRLVKAHVQTSSGSLVEELRYSYDKAGNRTKIEDQTPSGTTTTTYAYNAANELCWKYTGSSTNGCSTPPTGATLYAFDARGNQTAAGSSTLGYDNHDRLTALSGAAAGYLSASNNELVSFGSTAYQSGALGMSRQFGASSTTNYVRDPAGEPSSQRVGASKQFFLNDVLGSTIALTDGSGAIVRSYAYDPDGNASSTGSGATTDLRFAGGQVVGGLYHYGARYYDPATARWTQQDPIANYTDVTQANRYTYASDDPINLADPTGASSRLRRFAWCMAVNLSSMGADACVESCTNCGEALVFGGSILNPSCIICAACVFIKGIDFDVIRQLARFCWRWSKHGRIGSQSCLIA